MKNLPDFKEFINNFKEGEKNVLYPIFANKYILYPSIFDTIINYRLIKKKLEKHNQDKFASELEIQLKKYDIKLKEKGQKPIKLFTDYVSKYDWAEKAINDGIDNFDPYDLHFPNMDKETRKNYSDAFRLYLRKDFTIKEILSIMTNLNSLIFKVFRQIKCQICFNLTFEESKLKPNPIDEYCDSKSSEISKLYNKYSK